ncbi:GH25 family lysozyme [Lacticaseibacillus hegangensis]|uniref:Lysozyme n=1 Tax=Lacticaseibacillus hegangensis TaxID=2486010 RepID=A0ABW4CYJ4_9LACO|nr:GH25 family lysozyme [Lacticaseibacillus hegangensis]
MAQIVLDVASYQPDTASWFRSAYDKGARAVIVKLTEGTTYRNPKAKAQLAAARAAGMAVHAYHYARWTNPTQATAEGKFFAAEAKWLGLGADSVLADDIEERAQGSALTSAANAFTAATKGAGFPKADVYSMRSWFQDGHLVPSLLTVKNLWVAEFGVAAVKMSGVGTWQFTSNWSGLNVDASYDYKGLYTGVTAPAAAPTPTAAAVSWIKQAGTFILDRDVYLRAAPLTGGVIALLHKGDKVKYDAYAYIGGYVVVRQPRGSKDYGYIASGTASGTKRTSYWGTFTK